MCDFWAWTRGQHFAVFQARAHRAGQGADDSRRHQIGFADELGGKSGSRSAVHKLGIALLHHAASLHHADGHFDPIVSHVLLNETSGRAVRDIRRECYRLLAPCGVMALPSYRCTGNEPFWSGLRAAESPSSEQLRLRVSEWQPDRQRSALHLPLPVAQRYMPSSLAGTSQSQPEHRNDREQAYTTDYSTAHTNLAFRGAHCAHEPMWSQLQATSDGATG